MLPCRELASANCNSETATSTEAIANCCFAFAKFHLACTTEVDDDTETCDLESEMSMAAVSAGQAAITPMVEAASGVVAVVTDVVVVFTSGIVELDAKLITSQLQHAGHTEHPCIREQASNNTYDNNDQYNK